MSKVIVNKVAVAKFLKDRGIPVSEALFAAVILGDQGIGVAAVADAFDVNVKDAEHFAAVEAALEEAKDRVIARDIEGAARRAAGQVRSTAEVFAAAVSAA